MTVKLSLIPLLNRENQMKTPSLRTAKICERFENVADFVPIVRSASLVLVMSVVLVCPDFVEILIYLLDNSVIKVRQVVFDVQLGKLRHLVIATQPKSVTNHFRVKKEIAEFSEPSVVLIVAHNPLNPICD
jgi:hypothetical protein